jgi:hypothetical protein
MITRTFTIIDQSWNYGMCGFCKCRTNANRRVCCKDGMEEDDKISKQTNKIMKQIQLITAILLTIKEFGTDKFSIYNITENIRDHLNMGDYEVTEDGRYSSNLTHQEVKDSFEELYNNGLLSNYDKSFNSQGYREYQLNDVFDANLDDDLDDDLVGIPATPSPVILTMDKIKNACVSSGIPFDVQKKMYFYIKNNGPVTMKQIQSRLKGPFTCSQLLDFLSKINLIDTNTTLNYPSHVKTVKFN